MDDGAVHFPRRFVALMVAVMLTAACATPPTPVEGLPEPDTCGAAAFADLLGQPRSALAGLSLPERTRILEPGAVMTMDYSDGRLNIMLDASGTITELKCF